MNRNDVIDVLTAVAAASHRTVGNADVDIWEGIIGDLQKDSSLRAVRDHLREKPGVWLEPGHIYERVRAYRRDQLEREPDEAREARQSALEVKVAEDVAELAAGKSIPDDKYRRLEGNPLLTPCGWCGAGVGSGCTIPGTRDLLQKGRRFHPSRLDAAKRRAA